ncbi:DUF2787 family protein [Alteromonas sp. NFXS44]|uniref:DUF2787 family protein n=1 Tax=Alteromonas sp. NFXS44 TaxID=2818435 RepID=UPI0032DF9C96
MPVSKQFVDALEQEIGDTPASTCAVTLNFRDPDYSAETGGFHPVEIRLEKHGGTWHFSYITDFTYVGIGPYAELAKDLDFDFQAGVFQNLHGMYPIEVALDIYQIWESNFLPYWEALNIFTIQSLTAVATILTFPLNGSFAAS